jgi:phosphatidylserine/phosphatidylglycerophosphate/cardiolipin synthase-like enzyme
VPNPEKTALQGLSALLVRRARFSLDRGGAAMRRHLCFNLPIVFSGTCLFMVGLVSCGQDMKIDLGAPGHDGFSIQEGSAEAQLVLTFINRSETTFEVLDIDVALDKRAAKNIIRHRDGTDGLFGTADDNGFDTVAELDGISYVGNRALEKLLIYAASHQENGPQSNTLTYDEIVLLVANDPSIGFYALDVDIGLDRRAAEGIVAFRSGVDGVFGSSDDQNFHALQELDAISYVGQAALDKMYHWGIVHGYGQSPIDVQADVIFSPRLYPLSHNVRVAQEVDSAQESIDIAIYSFSDNGIYDALERAVLRNVEVRAIFETANADRKKEGADFENSRSSRLERMGINVRYVNKIMHHKFMIIDGPQKDLSTAQTALLITGSGNWSWGAATKYDENTLFLKGYAGLVLSMQREFDLMWAHSRDFVYDDTLPYEISSLEITDSHIESYGLGTDTVDAFFTSDNFTVTGDTFRKTNLSVVTDALVGAIQNATESIWVASGHLRLRGVSEALMDKFAANPDLDIRIMLDGQEYISAGYHQHQLQQREECLDTATTESRIRRCNEKGFLFGYQVSAAGIPVRFKYYAYRWHYSYAIQMHHKYMIIDGDELWTGSYNLSDNAEHNTFENIVVLKGSEFEELLASYKENFTAVWELNREDDTYSSLFAQITESATIPLVFSPMSLTWSEIQTLKATILENCPAVASVAFRTEPQDHKICARGADSQ